MSVKIVAAIVLSAAIGSTARIAAADEATEITLRDNVYTFASPGNAVGPWYALKLDVSHAFSRDRVLLRAVNGFHDRLVPSHGEFVRLEDYHRISSAVVLKVAAGSGSGYQPVRSAVLEASVALPRMRGVALALGAVETSNHNGTFQRIVAAGSDVSAGSFTANLRYYRASLGTNVVAPSSYELLASQRVSRRLAVGAIADLGGEVGGDRTASQLPTSSGLYGPALGLSASYGVERFRLTAGFQEGRYRSARTGAFAYRQYVTNVGLSTAVGP
jgi:hypothetical protein